MIVQRHPKKIGCRCKKNLKKHLTKQNEYAIMNRLEYNKRIPYSTDSRQRVSAEVQPRSAGRSRLIRELRLSDVSGEAFLMPPFGCLFGRSQNRR